MKLSKRVGVALALGIGFGGMAGTRAPAQDFLWTSTDGLRFSGRLLALEGSGDDLTFTIQAGSERRKVRARDLVAGQLAGVAGASLDSGKSGSTVLLVGGDRLCGEVRGGEGSGETFLLWSTSLGERAIPVDRVQALLMRGSGSELSAEDLKVPEGGKSEEAIFRATRRGVDTILGSIDRFTRNGILFQPSEARAAQEYPFTTILGIALRNGQHSKERFPARVLTRAGDHVAAAPISVSGDRIVLLIEGKQQVSVPITEIAAVTLVSDDRSFLSDLEPFEVEERSFYGGQARPLYPFQKDKAVGGSALCADGQIFGKGLGVHSRSRLVFFVPQGRSRFHALVGYDEEIKVLAWQRPRVDVRVLVDGKVIANFAGLRAGEPPQNLGAIPVKPGQKLTLEVDYGPDADHADRVDWLNAVLLR